jgi:O-antigen/teichoic acid export membrane protein
MSETRGIVRNALSTYGVRALLALSVLVLTPYLFRTLGPAAFGTWSVLYTIATVFSLIEFGFSTGATKLIAELRGAQRRGELEETVGASVALMAAIGVFACAVFVAVALLFDDLAAEPEREAFRQGMLLLGATMLVRLPTATYGATLLGYQRANLFNAGEGVTAIVFPLGAVVALQSGGGIFELAVAYAAALLAGSITFAILLKLTDARLPLRPRLGSRATRHRIAGFASLTLLADSMLFIGTRMDTVVIAAIRNAAAAAPFAAAVKLQSALQSLTFPIYLLFMPMVSELWSAGKRAEVRRRLILTTRIACQATLPAAFALALYADDITHFWLGADAPGVTAEIIAVLAASQAITLSVLPAERTLIGIGRVRLIAAIAVVEGVSNLALSIVLVSAYGAIGAALGTLFTYGLIAPVKLPLAARATNASLGRLLRDGFARAALSTAPAATWMIVAWALLPGQALRLAVGLVGGLAISAAIGAWQIGIPRLVTMVRDSSRRLPASPTMASEADVIEF